MHLVSSQHPAGASGLACNALIHAQGALHDPTLWYFAVLVFSMGVVLVAIAMVPIRVPAGALGIGGMILIAMAIVTGWTAGGLLFVGALFAVAGAVETARRMV